MAGRFLFRDFHIVNEQMSSSDGNAGSIIVNALHVKGPGIGIVVGPAESDITCS